MIWKIVSNIGLVSGITITIFVIMRQFMLRKGRTYSNFLKQIAKTNKKSLLKGKTILVTGANSGIGKAAVCEFLRHGAKIIMACRNTKKAESALEEYIHHQLVSNKDSEKNMDNGTNSLGQVVIKHLDLSDLRSVKFFAQDILTTEPRLDILINNAGIFNAKEIPTVQGYEQHFGVNHLGHFYLTLLLLPLLRKTGELNAKTPSTNDHVTKEGGDGRKKLRSDDDFFGVNAKTRIVVVASALHKYGELDFEGGQKSVKGSYWSAYSNSKLVNVLFARELARRLQMGEALGYGDSANISKPAPVTVNSLHPGVVVTNMSKNTDHPSLAIWFYLNFGTLFAKSPLQGCQTTLYCALAPELENVSGRYFGDCEEHETSPKAKDDRLAKELWDFSLECIRDFEKNESTPDDPQPF